MEQEEEGGYLWWRPDEVREEVTGQKLDRHLRRESRWGQHGCGWSARESGQSRGPGKPRADATCIGWPQSHVFLPTASVYWGPTDCSAQSASFPPPSRLLPYNNYRGSLRSESRCHQPRGSPKRPRFLLNSTPKPILPSLPHICYVPSPFCFHICPPRWYVIPHVSPATLVLSLEHAGNAPQPFQLWIGQHLVSQLPAVVPASHCRPVRPLWQNYEMRAASAPAPYGNYTLLE